MTGEKPAVSRAPGIIGKVAAGVFGLIIVDILSHPANPFRKVRRSHRDDD